MQNPLEITFRNMDLNEKIETLIHEKFENVKIISPDVTKCHIILEKLSKHHQSANRSCVRLDLKVPHINDIIVAEKCNEDEASMLSTVIKVFKRSKALLREEVTRIRDRKRVSAPDHAMIEPEEDLEEIEG